jgi:hypothetical protein
VLNKLLRGLLSHIEVAQAPERNPFKQMAPAPWPKRRRPQRGAQL